MDYFTLYQQQEINTPRQIIELRAKNDPDSIVFQYAKKKQTVSVTCGEFWRDINVLGTYFHQQGLRGSRIAVLGPNSYYWILTWFAAVLSGNVIVPLDKDQSPEELGELLRRCGASGMVCASTYFDVAEKLWASADLALALSMDDVAEILRDNDGSLDDIGADARQDPDALCSIIFTSGTTGVPKGVMLTQRAIAADALNASYSLWVNGSSVLTLPLHHTFGFTVGVLSAYICGYPIYISKSLRTFTNELKSFRPVNLVVVPLYVETLYKSVWRAAKESGREARLQRAIRVSNALRKAGIDLRNKFFREVREQFGGNLRHIVCGGAFLDQRYIDFLDDIGVMVLNGYGITECSPVVSVNRSDRRRKNSIGLPLPGVEVRIIDGEICVRGDNVMAGYYDDEESTAEVMEDGWFHTGDLGRVDGDGFVYITGRKKNLIILANGENISAEELEEKLLRIEHVDEVVVRGEDDVITAEIYAEDRTGIDDAVADLNRRLPACKRIQRIRYRMTEFEKTTTRKIKRVYSASLSQK